MGLVKRPAMDLYHLMSGLFYQELKKMDLKPNDVRMQNRQIDYCEQIVLLSAIYRLFFMPDGKFYNQVEKYETKMLLELIPICEEDHVIMTFGSFFSDYWAEEKDIILDHIRENQKAQRADRPFVYSDGIKTGNFKPHGQLEDSSNDQINNMNSRFNSNFNPNPNNNNNNDDGKRKDATYISFIGKTLSSFGDELHSDLKHKENCPSKASIQDALNTFKQLRIKTRKYYIIETDDKRSRNNNNNNNNERNEERNKPIEDMNSSEFETSCLIEGDHCVLISTAFLTNTKYSTLFETIIENILFQHTIPRKILTFVPVSGYPWLMRCISVDQDERKYEREMDRFSEMFEEDKEKKIFDQRKTKKIKLDNESIVFKNNLYVSEHARLFMDDSVEEYQEKLFFRLDTDYDTAMWKTLIWKYVENAFMDFEYIISNYHPKSHMDRLKEYVTRLRLKTELYPDSEIARCIQDEEKIINKNYKPTDIYNMGNRANKNPFLLQTAKFGGKSVRFNIEAPQTNISVPDNNNDKFEKIQNIQKTTEDILSIGLSNSNRIFTSIDPYQVVLKNNNNQIQQQPKNNNNNNNNNDVDDVDVDDDDNDDGKSKNTSQSDFSAFIYKMNNDVNLNKTRRNDWNKHK